MPPLLNVSEILKNSSPQLPPSLKILILDQIDSTNSEAQRLISEKKMPPPLVIFAESQTQGRGRLDRKWESPAYQNLYLSLVIELPSQNLLAQNTLICGIALLESLLPLVPQGLQLKWPNDVLLNKKKVAGILSELVLNIGQPAKLIIGVGINVNAGPKDFSETLSNKATSLKIEFSKDFNRAEIAGRFLASFFSAFEEYFQTGFAPFREKWEGYAKPWGTRVSVEEAELRYEGTYLGLNKEGYLRVQTATGENLVIAGDVNWGI
ncbi:MAG: biotin--[acetyl-CoA-carboxylase] ligase [Deltaproteobacteria bacterium]|nr:biotin--[acetyl-CoA-carboxylase] ligase [Deltaproteobacteria bacterium]